MKIEGKVVVVTGGASGIGRALCERFAREGARGVAVADQNGAGAEAVAKAIGGATFGIACDVASPSGNEELVRRTEKAFGPIDLFCCNAGIATGGVILIRFPATARSLLAGSIIDLVRVRGLELHEAFFVLTPSRVRIAQVRR